MTWGNKKITRDDTDYAKPRQLPPNGWANPERRAADAAIEALKRSDGECVYDATGEDLAPAEPRILSSLVDIQRMEHEMVEGQRIDAIKALVRKLTYGEMMELADQWSAAMLTGSVDNEQFKYVLPPTLHAWATKTEKTS